jgi:hypothetical protein
MSEQAQVAAISALGAATRKFVSHGLGYRVRGPWLEVSARFDSFRQERQAKSRSCPNVVRVHTKDLPIFFDKTILCRAISLRW